MAFIRDMTPDHPVATSLLHHGGHAAAFEYGLIAALIVVAVIAVIRLARANLSRRLRDIATDL